MAAVLATQESRLEARLQQAMLGLLAFYVFALPLVEAPKNLAAGLYVMVWAVHAAISRDLGGRWSRFDSAFLLMLVSALLSGLMGYAADVSGVFRVFLLGWVVSRSPLAANMGRAIPLAACAGLLLGVVVGAVPFLRGTESFLELPSVGHVNQSALYIAIMAAAAFGWWLQGAQAGQGGRYQAALALSATVFCAALLAGGSRAAIGGALVAVLVLIAAVLAASREPRVRRVLVRAALTVAVLAALIAALGVVAPNLSDRKLTLDGLVKTASTQTRVRHWHIAVEAWRQRPWVGWGPDSFKQFTVPQVCEWRKQRGEACNPADYLEQTHAHSLYAGTLVERGLLGMLALGVLLAVWAWSLVRAARTSADSWLWVASAASLVTVVVGGTFNTTLRVEHGSLALLWFGLWIAAAGRAARAGRLAGT